MTRNPEEKEGYPEVVRITHRGIQFFVANYRNHAVLEPIDEEISHMLPESDNGLWNDSCHSWADGMHIAAQRAKLIGEARRYIDAVIEGDEFRNMLEYEIRDLVAKIEQYQKRQTFFKRAARGGNEK